MADFGSPVAQNVTVPQPLTTLSNLLSIKQQQQQLQTGQYIQQATQAEAQKGQQAMAGRQATQQMFQTGKDDLGNSIRGPDGDLDLSTVIPALGRMDPLNGQATAQALIKTKTDKVGLQAASANLDQGERGMLGELAGANADNPQATSADFGASVDNLVAKHPEMANAAGYYKSLAAHIDNTTDPQQKKQAWQHLQMLTQDVGGQQAQQNPIPGSVNTGMQVIPTVTPKATGITQAANAPPIANLVPTPGDRLPHLGSNAAGQTVAINPLNPNQMAPAGSGQAPTYPGVKPVPPGITQTPGMPASAPPGLGVNPAMPAVTAANKVAQESAGTFSGNVAAASKVPQLRNALQNIIRLSDQVTSGPETDRVNKIKAMVGNAIPGSNGWQNSSSAYQEMTKYMEQAALASWGAAGGTGTNEQYEAQKMANPNNQYNSTAVKSLAKWVLAGQDAQQSKTNAMLKWAKEPGNGPQNQYDFENKWANVMDPRAFQVAHMTPHEALEAFPNKSDRDEIRQSIGNLKQFMANPTTQ